ncbi:tRNA uridine-5-carboxymethylaminomethyl(34) synthesis GTPase MnmE [Rhabdochromatium marinum]|uniref:tRNA uridine-5-carboxymethylaminomethyl(34) synthesis GTPase MnmE n=1 Tax=Rhabdochromatium marinum TaxID=48729 RepID=UPI001907C699|nr:tRNA uridine-5-carboxymethylaminomethyl(34) synthesis GTPase MnmE [Rhabdochromatium marinum]MBK1647950.1 tRNA uridine-5-carboxymethylaminomethyl(34) synthesis GTPase MnmE [Rhabdochromatium marinum]
MVAVVPDTIAAIATAPGRGGIGVVRLSGSLSHIEVIAAALLDKPVPPRRAVLASFRDASGEGLDQGIALLFPAPGSYTGETVLELQGHGSPVVLDQLLARVLELGARLARPGEFTERAFLNGKLDLSQAEAVADLIASTNQTQARLAKRTLQGALAAHVQGLQTRLTQIRVRLEAGLDFSDEDIEPDDWSLIGPEIAQSIAAVNELLALSHQGERVRDGLTLVIAGPPNAGKSSLLNRLSGQETAIVTATPGTTRDLIHSAIHLDGMPLHLIDTAGIRDSADAIEQEGIRRAREQMQYADRVLWLYDAAEGGRPSPDSLQQAAAGRPITLVRNKIDRLGEPAGMSSALAGDCAYPELRLSAKTGEGIEQLKAHLKEQAGYQAPAEGAFIARRRHVIALEDSRASLEQAQSNLIAQQPAEIIAEDLRLAQRALGTITGELRSDDLLGEIFASFCIGK